VNVVVDLDSPQELWRGLGDGWRAEARILVDAVPDAIVVPQSAVFREGDGWALYRVDDRGEAHRTVVELGLRNGLEAQVTGGLAVDDRVVVFPGDRVVDGVRVVAR
jgi:HlyD family secretion protein